MYTLAFIYSLTKGVKILCFGSEMHRTCEFYSAATLFDTARCLTRLRFFLV
jgi:hypothetical protein